MSEPNLTDEWPRLLTTMEELVPIQEGAIPLDWLKWIKPPPVDAAEMKQLSASIATLVSGIQYGFFLQSRARDLADYARESKSHAVNFHAAIKALKKLPDSTSGHPLVVATLKFLAVASEINDEGIETVRNTFPKKGKGRPQDREQTEAVLSWFLLLTEHGKEATRGRAGTIAALSQWSWKLATNESCSLDAWGETIKRAMSMF